MSQGVEFNAFELSACLEIGEVVYKGKIPEGDVFGVCALQVLIAQNHVDVEASVLSHWSSIHS